MLQRPAGKEEVNSQGGGAALGFDYELLIQQVRVQNDDQSSELCNTT